jgi:hypothetical protein
VHKGLQLAVQGLDRQAVGDALGLGEVADCSKGVVGQTMGNVALAQLCSQPEVAVAVELQSERTPCRHAQIAQPQLFVDEVEIVVEALAVAGTQERFPGALVMPRLVRQTGLHRREDRHQPGVRTTGLSMSC